MFLLQECISKAKGKLFCRLLMYFLIPGLDIYSRTILKIESKFVACCLNSGGSSTSSLVAFVFYDVGLPLMSLLEVH